MLIEFRVGNFLSFKNENTLSLVASALKDPRVPDKSVIFNPEGSDKIQLLRSAVIYGANASGKSNLIKALIFFKQFIKTSISTEETDDILVENFKLSSETEKQPSTFEAIFVYNGKQFRYGFGLSLIGIAAEWLYIKELKPKAKESELFFREGQVFKFKADFHVGKDLVKKKMIRNNSLLLTAAAQFNDTTALEVFKWVNSLNAISGNRNDQYSKYTTTKLLDKKFRQKILDFTKFADLGIDDIQVVQGEVTNVNVKGNSKTTDELKKSLLGKPVNSVLSFHRKYDKTKKELELVQFLFAQSESEGTVKYFSLAGPIIDTLDNGRILAIDELDSKLHPLLTQKIIELFNSPETNKKNAQLIFTSHDTNLLGSNIFRRDQVYFTQKDRYGESSLYSLAEYAVRNDASFEKDYLTGKYGAIPVLRSFNKIFAKDSENGR